MNTTATTTTKIDDYEPKNYKEFKDLVRVAREELARTGRLYELILRFKTDILLEIGMTSRSRVLYNIGIDKNPKSAVFNILHTLLRLEEEGVNNEQQA